MNPILAARVNGECIYTTDGPLCGKPVQGNTFHCEEHATAEQPLAPLFPTTDPDALTLENFGERIDPIEHRWTLVNSALTFCSMAKDDLNPRWMPRGRDLARKNFAKNIEFAESALRALNHRSERPLDPLLPYPPGCPLLVALDAFLVRLRAAADAAFGGESAGEK